MRHVLNPKLMLKILSQTGKSWWANDPFTNSAATAYYAIFSLPGLLILVMGVATLFVEKRVVEVELLYHLQSVLGTEITNTLQNIVEQTRQSNKSIFAVILGFITLSFAATGLFAQLQRTLNKVWDVEVKKKTRVPKFIRNRLISFGTIVVIGFLLMTSLTMTALLNYFSGWMAETAGPSMVVLVKWVDFAISFCIITFLFSFMFKVMPDAHVMWRYALWGGAVSTVFFNIGEYAINYYFQMAEPASAFGAAGSMVLLLLWVSYSCLILLIGAEFAKAAMENIEGHKVAPDRDISKKVRREDG